MNSSLSTNHSRMNFERLFVFLTLIVLFIRSSNFKFWVYSDPDGLITLSDTNFWKWVRPSEKMNNPKMISTISSKSIRQVMRHLSFSQILNVSLQTANRLQNHPLPKTIVADCSFVASLCVAAAYEEKFKKQVRIISERDFCFVIIRNPSQPFPKFS